MKKITKITSIVALFLCSSFLNINDLKAQNNSTLQSGGQVVGTGTIIFLNTSLNTSLSTGTNSSTSTNTNSNSGLRSGLIQDDNTGEVYEFHYAGLEVLEIDGKYTYILQITASGKVIVRDIRHTSGTSN